MKNRIHQEITLLRIVISDTAWQSEQHINWQARDGDKLRRLKLLHALASQLQRKLGDHVHLTAFE